MRHLVALYGLLLLLFPWPLFAQRLQPGFNKAEYLELLRVSARQGDSIFFKGIAKPSQFRLAYRSPVVGLDNRWDLWTNDRATAVLSIRGTTLKDVSWLENFYAAMTPARGTMQLSKTRTISYDLADNPRATVHVGWLLGMTSLADDMLAKIDSCYRRGTKDFYIMGHSQGGAIAYLFTAQVLRMQKQGRLPADIRFKTYCSAAPKPGNLYFAYEYEAAVQGGWGFNVVNPADWVPETPLSLQTMADFNVGAPFAGAKTLIRKQKFPKNLLLLYAYGRLTKTPRKAQRTYRRFLGNAVERQVAKELPEFEAPPYADNNAYVRTGTTIILPADSTYFKLYPTNPEKIFTHHLFQPYVYLAEHLP